MLFNGIMPNARTRLTDETDWAWAREVKDVGATLAQLTATPPTAASGRARNGSPAMEDMATHWTESCDSAGFAAPQSVYDEALAARGRVAAAMTNEG